MDIGEVAITPLPGAVRRRICFGCNGRADCQEEKGMTAALIRLCHFVVPMRYFVTFFKKWRCATKDRGGTARARLAMPAKGVKTLLRREAPALQELYSSFAPTEGGQELIDASALSEMSLRHQAPFQRMHLTAL